jgi:hemoglobin/transferrin/lactoferrin receptor protein
MGIGDNSAKGIAAKSRYLALLMTGTALATAMALAPANGQGAPAIAGSGTSVAAINIPPQPLASALVAFSRQTRVQVLIDQSLASGRTSPGVSGAMAPTAALGRLLAGTGLRYRFSGANAVVVERAATSPSSGASTAAPAGAISLDTIDVQGGAPAIGSAGEIVINSQELARRNPTDARGVFAGEPGVQVGGAMPMTQKVYVNGIEETNLAVSIDGSRQNNRVFHHNATTLIDPAFLRTVRVDAGIAPADAGPGALAGAIRYETKSALDFLSAPGFGAFLKSSFETNGGVFRQILSGYARTGNVDAIGYFSYARGSEFTAGGGGVVPGTSTNILSGYMKLGYETDNGYRIQFSHEQIVDDAPRPFRANIGFISGRPPGEPTIRDYRMNRSNTVLQITRTSPDGLWDPTALIAYSRTVLNTPIWIRATNTNIPGSGATESLNGKFENKFAFSLGNIVAGFDFYSDRANYTDPTYAVQERASNVGGYVQARIQPVERLRLSFGFRGDVHRLVGTNGTHWDNSGLSANISGEFDIVSNFLIAKAGYSTIFGGVPMAENYIQNTAWNYGTGPRAVTARNATAGLEMRWQGLILGGRVFRTNIDNARAASFSPATNAIRTRNIESEGYELTAAYSWGSGFVRAKFVDTRVKIDGQPADTDTGTYLASPVGRVFTLTAAHTLQQIPLTVGGDIEYTPAYSYVPAGVQPYKGYEVVNLFAEYRPPSMPNLTLRVDLKNMLDKRYSQRTTYGHEFPTVTPLYQPGRSLVLSASAQF